MVLGIHLAYGIDDGAVRTYHIGGSEGAFAFPAAEDLSAPGFVGLEYCAVLVGEEMEGEFIFGYEFLVGGLGVLAHAEYAPALCKEPFVIVPEIACLGRAARSAVLGIEVQNQGLTGEITEFHDIAVLVRCGEVRRFASCCQHNVKV